MTITDPQLVRVHVERWPCFSQITRGDRDAARLLDELRGTTSPLDPALIEAETCRHSQGAGRPHAR